jgi:hypothetical protein
MPQVGDAAPYDYYRSGDGYQAPSGYQSSGDYQVPSGYQSRPGYEPPWDSGLPEPDPAFRYREPGPGMPGYRGSRDARYGGDTR